MNSLKAMYGCGLNFFIKLAYNSLFLYKFALHLQQIIIILSQNKYYCSKKMNKMTKNLVAFLT